MSGLLELAERVEALSGPDRETDGDIECAANGREKRWSEAFNAFQFWKNGRWIGLGTVPEYTASLDAAMTLVPERVTTELVLQDRHSLRWKWTLRDFQAVRHDARANTPALALVSAALRARAVAGSAA